MEKEQSESTPGLAIDSRGGPVVDPTKNVQDLSAASNRRQDDLREAQNKYMELAVAHLKDRQELISAHNKEVQELRADQQKELAAKESQRLDSIRSVDQLAVTTAANRALDAIQALAATTTANADNLRTSQANMAATIAAQTATQLSAINEAIAALQKSSYEGAGKQAYSDPMMAQLVSEMKALRESTSTGSGRNEGIGISWGVVTVVVALIIAAMGTFYGITKTSSTPQVIYAPVPLATKP